PPRRPARDHTGSRRPRSMTRANDRDRGRSFRGDRLQALRQRGAIFATAAVSAGDIAGRLFGRRDLGQMPLDERARLCEKRAARTIERRQLILHAANLRAAVLHDSLRFGPRLADDERGFLVRLLADVAAELLRRDERFVDRLVALAERAQ